MKIIFLLAIATCVNLPSPVNDDYITYIADPAKEDIRLFWKNENNEKFKSIQALKSWVEKNNQSLVFAMNGGMYTKENAPLGLYVENQKVLGRLNTAMGAGNFYLKPNGVFYITTKNIAVVCNTIDFVDRKNIKYATQSGPLLLTDGNIHPAFNKASTNLNIRNGVGILPGNKIIFAMSKREVNFYEFASFFKKSGCKNALYLDGLVSRTYLPSKNWIQTDGNFGVIIGIVSDRYVHK